MTASAELKPCPFCKKSELKYIAVFSEDEPIFQIGWQVFCEVCHARGPASTRIGWCETTDAARDAWNRRGDSEYTELIERLRSNHTLDTPRNTLTGSLINPDGPAAANHIEDLLAEIASLRSERDEWKELAHLSGLRAKRVKDDGYPEDRESEGMTVCGECGGWGEHLMSCVRGGYKPENYR